MIQVDGATLEVLRDATLIIVFGLAAAGGRLVVIATRPVTRLVSLADVPATPTVGLPRCRPIPSEPEARPPS